MLNTLNIELLKNKIKNCSKNTKIYLGCDSKVLKKRKKVKFATVVVFHINGNMGCEVYGEVTFEELSTIKDFQKSKPYNRMMKEVEKITTLYNLLEEVLIDKDFEIHIDVNQSKLFGSNIAYGSAKGYIESIIGIEPVFKPFAFAASYAADHYIKD